jgi:hypothetical protein
MFCDATFCAFVGFDRPAVFEVSLLKRRKITFSGHSGDNCFAMPHSARSWNSVGQLSLKCLFFKRRKNPLTLTFRRQLFCDATFCSIVGFCWPAVRVVSFLQKKKNPRPLRFRRQMFCGGTFCSIVGFCWPAVRVVSLLQKKKNPLTLTFRRQMFCDATFCSI